MGKKTHPAAIRIDFSGWQNSIWYTRGKNFASRIAEDYHIRKICFGFYEDGMLCDVTIERVAGVVIASLHTHRPGALYGEKGSNIEKLKNKIIKKLGIEIKLNVIEVYRPEANAQFICDQIVKQLVNRADYKKMAKSCMKFAMKSAIVKGLSITVGGRLGGASIARTDRFKIGSVARQTFRDKIIYKKKAAKTIYGMCGVRVLVSYNNNNFLRDNNFDKDFKKDRGDRDSNFRRDRNNNPRGVTGGSNYRGNSNNYRFNNSNHHGNKDNLNQNNVGGQDVIIAQES
jgi:small subunit ribosomal protein S3